MKDQARIERICKLLKKNWLRVPDQRLGQFLANYVFGHHRDIFFQEDSKTERYLKIMEKEAKKIKSEIRKVKKWWG